MGSKRWHHDRSIQHPTTLHIVLTTRISSTYLLLLLDAGRVDAGLCIVWRLKGGNILSSLVHPFYPQRCPQCGLHFTGLWDRLSHICPTRDPYAYRYEDTEETEPALPVVTAGEFEEVTPAHAALFYQHALQNALDHIKSCTTCRYLAKDDSVCDDMKRLRRICEKWLVLKTASR